MRIITILLLTCSLCFGTTNFTDVTIQGTPYLTTNVLMEIAESVSVRAGSINARYRTEGYYVEGTDIWYDTIGYKTVRSPFAGMILNKNYINAPTYRYSFVVEVRKWISHYYVRWSPSLPAGITNRNELAYESITNFFVAVGLSSNGWRTAYSYDPSTNNWRNFDDAMYGTNQNNNSSGSSLLSGEIFGPWMIDDLQIALDGMQYVWKTPRSTTNDAYELLGPIRVSTNWEEVKLATESNSFIRASYGSGCMYSEAKVNTFYNPDRYSAKFESSEQFLLLGAREVDSALYTYGGSNFVYGLATAPDINTINVFDKNDQSWAIEGEYSLIESYVIPQNTTAKATKTKICSAIVPEWCDKPEIGNSTSKGIFINSTLEFMTINFPFVRE